MSSSCPTETGSRQASPRLIVGVRFRTVLTRYDNVVYEERPFRPSEISTRSDLSHWICEDQAIAILLHHFYFTCISQLGVVVYGMEAVPHSLSWSIFSSKVSANNQGLFNFTIFCFNNYFWFLCVI